MGWGEHIAKHLPLQTSEEVLCPRAPRTGLNVNSVCTVCTVKLILWGLIENYARIVVFPISTGELL